MRALWLIAALSACSGKVVEEPPASGPIVVYFTVDTLGLRAARETGWCAAVQGIAGRYGLDAACPEGAVAPSSWTGESHTRTLFPQHLSGALRHRKTPSCDPAPEPFTAQIAAAHEARYVFGADNPVFSGAKNQPCEGGEIAWHRGADAVYTSEQDGADMAGVAEADRAVHAAIADLLVAVERGDGVVAFLNALEVGGHFPRCWFDPSTPACRGLWKLAVDAGIATDAEDPAERFLQARFEDALTGVVAGMTGEEMRLRPLFWGSMLESIEYHRGPLFEERLERILAGVQAAGRTDDLTIVILGDHGENPCAERPFSGVVACKHGAVPTEWTGIVPVYTIPASRAAEWEAAGYIGDASRPWSSANLSWALLDSADVPVPADWPAMEPVGQATSWACLTNAESGAEPAGARVAGDVSVRCEGAACGAWGWREPDGELYLPEPVAAVPEELQAFAEGWVAEACAAPE